MSSSNMDVKSMFRQKSLTSIGKTQEEILLKPVAWQHDSQGPIPDKIKDDIINHHRRLRQAPQGTTSGPSTTPGKRKHHSTGHEELAEQIEAPVSDPESPEGTTISWEASPQRSRIQAPSHGRDLLVRAASERAEAAAAPQTQSTDPKDVRSSDLDPIDVELPQAEPAIVIRNSSAARAPSPQQTPSCAQPISNETPFSEAIVPETVIGKRPPDAGSKPRKKIKSSPFAPILTPGLQDRAMQSNDALRGARVQTAVTRAQAPRIMESLETRREHTSVDTSKTSETEINSPASTPKPVNRSFQELKSRGEMAYEAGLHLQRLNRDPFTVFTEIYPEYTQTYSGDLRPFIKACIYLEYLQQRRKLKESCWDELIRAFSSGYIPYLDSDPPEPLSMIEWFGDATGPNVFEGGVIIRQNLQYVFQRHPNETKSIRQEAKNREIGVQTSQKLASTAPASTLELPPLPVEYINKPPSFIQVSRQKSPELGSEETRPPALPLASSATRKMRRSIPSYLDGRSSTTAKGKPIADRESRLAEHFRRRVSEGFVAGSPASTNKAKRPLSGQ